MVDIGDINGDLPVPDVLKKVGWVIEDAKSAAEPSSTAVPGLELLEIWTLVECIETYDIVLKNCP